MRRLKTPLRHHKRMQDTLGGLKIVPLGEPLSAAPILDQKEVATQLRCRGGKLIPDRGMQREVAVRALKAQAWRVASR